MANFSWLIPQTTLTASGYSVNLNVDRELYLTIANLGSTYGGEDVTISASWQDSTGAGQKVSIVAGGSFGPAFVSIRTLQITGSGASVVGEISSSKTTAESLLATAVLANVKGATTVYVQDPNSNNNYPIQFTPTGASQTIPASGILRGFCIPVDSGLYTISIGGVNITLGKAAPGDISTPTATIPYAIPVQKGKSIQILPSGNPSWNSTPGVITPS